MSNRSALPDPTPPTERLSPKHTAIAAALVGAAIAAACVLVPNRRMSWDVLERSYTLLHWDDASPFVRYFWAHVLELPLARPFAAAASALGRPDRALPWMESLAAGALVAGALVVTARASGRIRYATAASLALAAAGSLWVFAAGGEEKVIGALSLLTALTLALRVVSTGGSATHVSVALAAVSLGLAPLVHLTNLVVYPVVGAMLAVNAFEARASRAEMFAALRRPLVMTALAVGLTLVGLIADEAIANRGVGIERPGLIAHFTRYHGGPNATSWAGVDLAAAVTGTAKTVFVRGIRWPGALTFVAVQALALACAATLFRRGRTRGVALAYLTLAVVWTAHFIRFEPWNPESWFALHLAAGLFSTWAIPILWPARVTLATRVLVVLALTQLALNAPAYARGGARPAAMRFVDAFDRAAPTPYVMICSDPFMARYMRLYARRAVRVFPVDVLARRAPEDCCAWEYVPVEGLGAFAARGVAIVADRASVERLGAWQVAQPLGRRETATLFVLRGPLRATVTTPPAPSLPSVR